MGASHQWLSFGSPLASLLTRARRRRLLHIVINEAALACAIVLAGAVLLLFIGAAIAAWYSLGGLLVVGLALACFRASRNVENDYAVAQRLDANLGLHDSLSTSVYFGEHPDRTGSPPDVVEKQRRAAEELARSLDVRHALPFARSQSLYACGGLVLAVVGVFGLRYGVTRSLDLRPSLVRIAFDGFLGPRLQTADARKKPKDPRAKDWQNPSGLSIDPWQAKAVDQQGAPEEALNTVDTPDVNNKDTGAAADTKAQGQKSQNPPDQNGDASDDSERSSGNDQAPDGAQAPSKEGGQAGKQQEGGSQRAQQSGGDNSSLSEKMRDALANLLSKLKMQPKSGGSSQQNSSSGQSGQQQSAQNRGNKDQSGTPGQGKPQADANSSPDGQSAQDAQGAQQAQAGQGKNGGKNPSTSPEGQSGIGKQDGDKSLKNAEELAAMGKISEIIGKRAQNVTGEVMIEVASGKQQLRTQYTQRSASHSDAGGEIGRDEVPLAYQQYVQQYFEEIRKLPAAKAKPAPAKGESKKAGS